MSDRTLLKSERINQLFFEVSQAVNGLSDLDDLYKSIHRILGAVMDNTNFFVALCDSTLGTVRFAYHVDEVDNQFNVDKTNHQIDLYEYSIKLSKGSLIKRVLESGMPLLTTRSELETYCREHQCHPLGTVPEIWLGVPLKAKNRILGVLAVQSYRDGNLFDETDARILHSVADQLATAIEKRSVELSLLSNQLRYQTLVENIKETIYLADQEGKFIFISSAVEALTGIHPSKMLNGNAWYRFLKGKTRSDDISTCFCQVIHPGDRNRVSEMIDRSMEQRKPYQTEYRIRTAEGRDRWVVEKGQIVNNAEGSWHLEGIILDIHEQKRAELINQALFNITNAVNTTLDLDELYRTIHSALRSVINVNNFYIAIYEKAIDTLFFPFEVDEREENLFKELSCVSNSTSLTWHVIRSGKPLMVNKKESYKVIEDRGEELIGNPAELWLGVPLKVRNEVIGAMVVQSYNDPDLYDRQDIEIMVSVSDQVATAIERKKYEENLVRNELQLKTMFEISNSIITTFNLDELYHSIHNSLKRIIDVHNFAIALYDAQQDVIEFPFLRDELSDDLKLTFENASKSGALTFEVIKRGEMLFLNEEEVPAYLERIGGKRFGMIPQSWLGIPLKGKNGTLGAIVIQNYQEPGHFKSREVKLLNAVSGQIAFAIERKQAEVELVKTQNEMINYAHKVGMADIANATLHNIGNILNSVKTSTDVIREVIASSHLNQYRQANALLRENMGQLSKFMNKGEKGQQLMEYFLQLEPEFENEQDEISKQVKRLNNKIKLMTDVIITQQGVANADFMSGEYHLAEIMDDALMMKGDELAQHNIQLEKQYQEVPAVIVQKTKLVHILVNLINNAKDAMVMTDAGERRLTATLCLVENQILISIGDTGVGISDQEMKKIFTHGYTTKVEGHGFGLHNAAIYLEEMKGRIWAESEGTGQGAVFYIQLPVVKGDDYQDKIPSIRN